MAVQGEDQAIAADEKKPTGLLDLPPEIWSEIGRLAVEREPQFTSIRLSLSSREPYHQPPITRVCRAPRNELSPYYYHHKIGNHGPPQFKRAGPIMATIKSTWVRAWLWAIEHENRQEVRGFVVFSRVESTAEAVKEFFQVKLELVMQTDIGWSTP